MQVRLIATLCGAFGTLALLLVSIGLYGIMAWSVARRTNEIGLRMALGAETSDVTWMVLHETLLLAGIGLAIGVPVSIAVARLISSRLFGLSPRDPRDHRKCGGSYDRARAAGGIHPGTTSVRSGSAHSAAA